MNVKIGHSREYCPACREQPPVPRLIVTISADLGPFRFIRLCEPCITQLIKALAATQPKG